MCPAGLVRVAAPITFGIRFVADAIADLPDSSLRARRLARSLRVSSPRHPIWRSIARRGHPADLAHHACFQYANAIDAWQFRSASGEEAAVAT